MRSSVYSGANRVKAITRDPVFQNIPPVKNLPNGMAMQARGLTRSATITSVARELLPIDFARRFLFIQNNHATGNIWVSFGAPGGIGKGIELLAGGGSLWMDNNCPTAAVTAIGTVASNTAITIITA